MQALERHLSIICSMLLSLYCCQSMSKLQIFSILHSPFITLVYMIYNINCSVISPHFPLWKVGLQVDIFTHAPVVVVWVFRWTFSSPSPPPSHLQLFVSHRYRKRCGCMSPSLSMQSCFSSSFFSTPLTFCSHKTYQHIVECGLWVCAKTRWHTQPRTHAAHGVFCT